MTTSENVHVSSCVVFLPSLITLYPLPVGLLGLTTTSMDCMSLELVLYSWCRALKDEQLNSSEPQKRIRRGSDFLEPVLYN